MKVELRERTEETVAIYFEKAQDAEIKKVLPQKAQTLEEALEDYRQTLKADATSYGRTIYADGVYIGDIWCYCIDLKEEPNAMLSYCIFEKEYWKRGVASRAVQMFLVEIIEKCSLETVGAFTYSSNEASIRVLEKNGFQKQEEFEEDGVLSAYFQRKCVTVSEKVIRSIGEKYDMPDVKIDSFFDTSHGEDDLRYNYVLDRKYVLKINSADMVTENFLQGINHLVEKYRAIGVWCPKVLPTKEGKLLYHFYEDGKHYHCYMEEFAPYEIAGNRVDFYGLKSEMLEHVGKLAAKYKGKDLVENRSMWSIIDLAPLDVEIDEKQDNLNTLAEALKEHGYSELAEKIVAVNGACRNHIMKYFMELPRCVYQGDLNPSNLLVDEKGHFAGLIDFNMYGTEVNVNCFLNECMYYLRESDFVEFSAKEIFEKMNRIQEQLMAVICKEYALNESEKCVYTDYKKVIDLSFYPNVMLWIELLEKKEYEGKVLALLELLCA